MSELVIHTSFVSPMTMKLLIGRQILPIFILRNIRNSEVIGKYSDSVIHFKELSPSNELFQAKRDKRISLEEFKKRYREEIAGLNFPKIIKRWEELSDISNSLGIALLGYGGDSEICHRSVLSDILNSSGLLNNKIEEIKWK